MTSHTLIRFIFNQQLSNIHSERKISLKIRFLQPINVNEFNITVNNLY